VLLRRVHRGGRRQRIELPVGLQGALDGPAREQPEQRIIDRQTLLPLLLRLGRGQRACVYLRYIEGLDDDQIATVLGCRASTVRSQVARGLRTMRPLLAEADVP
jgi:DNA-directed RNA polymerase specialized sigma24 family protein